MKKSRKVLIAIIVLFIPVLVNILMIPSCHYIKGDTNSWIGFYGNYLGGIIGASVAIIVVRLQSNEEKNIYNYQIRLNQLPYIALLKLELNKLKDELNHIVDIYNDLHGDSNKLSVMIKQVGNNPWKYISFIVNLDLQEKLIEIFDYYNDISELMSYDYIGAEEELARYEKILLEESFDGDGRFDEKNVNLRLKLRKLRTELNYHNIQKAEIIRKMISDNFISRIDDCIVELNNEKIIINKESKDK